MRYFDTRIWRLPSASVRGVHTGRQLDGTPLMFLHGLDGDLDEFHLIWPFVRRHRPVLAYDHPGFGPHAHHYPALDVEGMAAVAAEVIQTRCDGSPADVVGTSMGTMVTLALAHFYPDLVRRVVLLAPAGVWDWEPNVAGAAGAIAPWLEQPPLLAGMYAYNLIAHATENTPPGWTRGQWMRWALWRKSRKDQTMRVRAMLQTLPNLLDTDCTPWAAALDKPVLIACGDADAPHSVRASKRYHELIGNSRLIWLPGGRHMIWMGFYDRLGEEIDGFCSNAGMAGRRTNNSQT